MRFFCCAYSPPPDIVDSDAVATQQINPVIPFPIATQPAPVTMPSAVAVATSTSTSPTDTAPAPDADANPDTSFSSSGGTTDSSSNDKNALLTPVDASALPNAPALANAPVDDSGAPAPSSPKGSPKRQREITAADAQDIRRKVRVKTDENKVVGNTRRLAVESLVPYHYDANGRPRANQHYWRWQAKLASANKVLTPKPGEDLYAYRARFGLVAREEAEANGVTVKPEQPLSPPSSPVLRCTASRGVSRNWLPLIGHEYDPEAFADQFWRIRRGRPSPERLAWLEQHKDLQWVSPDGALIATLGDDGNFDNIRGVEDSDDLSSLVPDYIVPLYAPVPVATSVEMTRSFATMGPGSAPQ